MSKETSETMKQLLEAVVTDGTGRRAYLPGFRVGGKTATSENFQEEQENISLPSSDLPLLMILR